ncbi:nicotinate-nucleotide adenylyltransferase [Telmatocola sphagniphila]|uniref:Probable nicotinate-nucleotide adenylyltransferase n=1 Tax=Telmatocola sphagniphila TaxID=1123043 RepID=A0A8E6EV01_9BACT|nr:nicotinate-nucleotide adenylyltransferase [Telmatocola sphagniphila]QVL34309.1 nicotinate-nucleotide adenylyltransferase [Telmatocola sphagniphila]
MSIRIGIFGGTFDPIHLAHLLIAEQCREQARLEKILFIPSAVPPHKTLTNISSFSDRARMVELAIAGNSRFEIDLLESNRSGPSYTLDTLTELHASHPDWDIHFIIGADGILDLPGWHKPREILMKCQLCIVNRPGFPDVDIPALSRQLNTEIEDVKFSIVSVAQLDIASRDIRALHKKGASIRYMVPDSVRNWIVERGLYSETKELGSTEQK